MEPLSDYVVESIVKPNLVTSLDFTILLLATFAAVFVTPPLFGNKDFFKRTESATTWRQTLYHWWWQMPRPAMLFGHYLLTNILLAISIVYYLYNERNPLGTAASGWYVSIESLFFTIICLKFLWMGFVWNWHHYSMAMFLAIIKAFFIILLSFTLVILLGVRHSRVSMILMIFFLFFYMTPPFWTMNLYSGYAKKKKSEKEKRLPESSQMFGV